MKIERGKLKKGASEVPSDCAILIEKLKSCTEEELLRELSSLRVWNWGKCELLHWIDILDLFDGYLAEACGASTAQTGGAQSSGDLSTSLDCMAATDGDHSSEWVLPCDAPENEGRRRLLIAILQFTALLIEHSFSRHLYNSMEHLTRLLASSDMRTVLAVLNLLYVFSKRSNFITRLCAQRRQLLLDRLTHLAENWGGRENGFGLADCCRPRTINQYPASATTLHFEYQPTATASSGRTSSDHQQQKTGNIYVDGRIPSNVSGPAGVIHVERVDTLAASAGRIMADLMEQHPDVPEGKRMLLFTHLRLAHAFASYPRRLQCVQARLQALSILVYCSAIQENVNALLYNGLIDELVDVLELQLPHSAIQTSQHPSCLAGEHLQATSQCQGPNSNMSGSGGSCCEEGSSNCCGSDKMDEGSIECTGCVITGEGEIESLIEIKAAALRTLTAIIHLDGNPKLAAIIATTGATSYHGFLPTLVRACIDRLTATSSMSSNSVTGTGGGSSCSSALPHADGVSALPMSRNGSVLENGGSFSEGTIQMNDEGGMPNLAFATALFSFLYHLASYESGCEALVSCGMVQSLLAVIEWPGCEPEHVTFVTRAVRVIDLITGLDMAAFQTNGGLQTFIRRLEQEVDICRLDQPFVIPMGSDMDEANAGHPTLSTPRLATGATTPGPAIASSSSMALNTVANSLEDSSDSTIGMVHSSAVNSTLISIRSSQTQSVNPTTGSATLSTGGGGGVSGAPYTTGQIQCFPQRAALLKSMLNFLKKVISDQSAASESNRHLMDGSLPRSLQHIISNCEFYGASLFLLATDVVTVYVFQEPSLLSPLQDKGLTDVVLHALLTKEVPATREVLASLPNVFTALCLNTRGLEAFVQCQPFERILKVLISPDYLSAMRRRRSSEPLGDTAANLGNSMDELMRHQPSLRAPAMSAIVGLLRELCEMGSNPALVCLRTHGKPTGSGGSSSAGEGVDQGAGGRSGTDEEGSGAPETIENEGEGQVIEVSSESDNDDDDGEEERESPESRGTSVGQPGGANASSVTAGESAVGSSSGRASGTPASGCSGRAGSGIVGGSDTTAAARTTVPLVDYILNVTKFVDAILSNNSTDDHCKEFIRQRAHVPLLRILALPNLPLDFPISPACVGVASVCKSILNLAHEPVLLWEGLDQLNEVVQRLEPLYNPVPSEARGLTLAGTSSRPAGSILLQELVDARGAEPGPQTAPLFHAMAATHAYVVMFVHVCRTGQSDIRRLSVNHWGSELGLRVLSTLAQLYLALVWESTLLLSLRSDTVSSNAALSSSTCSGSANIARQQLARLAGIISASSSNGSGGLSNNTDEASSPMDVDQTDSKPASLASSQVGGSGGGNSNAKIAAAVKQIQPLLTGASRLGRALAELFGLLVKLCVGSPVRQRRNQQLTTQPAPPSPAAKAIAMALTRLLAQGLSWTPPKDSETLFDPSSTKSCFTLYICSAGFTSPMLFDERKMPYHLMLHKFVASGGLEAFFQAFEWAMKYWPGGDGNQENDAGTSNEDASTKGGPSEFTDVAGEFLDAWLLLLEKLTNPRAVIDTPHVLPSVTPMAGGQQQDTASEPHFNALQYLMHVHRRTFAACTRLWGRRPPRAYGDRMTESLLAILCHLLKGEAIINERLEQQQQSGTRGTSLLGGSQGHHSGALAQVNNAQTTMAADMIPLAGAEAETSEVTSDGLPGVLFGSAGSSSSGGAAGVASGSFAPFGMRPLEIVNNSTSGGSSGTSGLGATASAMEVQQLVDMGFDRARATAALAQARSLEQAAELLLSDPDAHQPPPTGHFHIVHPGVQQPSSTPEQMHAISDESNNEQQGSDAARSNRNSEGDSVGGLTVDCGQGGSTSMFSERGTVKHKEERLTNLAPIVHLEDEKPIDKAAMDSFTQERLLPGVLSLLGVLPDSVYRVCDLLAVVVARNGPEWRDFALQRLLGEVKARATHLLTSSTTENDNATPGNADTMDSINDASQHLAVIVHLVTLLFDEMRPACAQLLEQSEMVPLLCLLVEKYASNAPPRTQPQHHYQSSDPGTASSHVVNTGGQSSTISARSAPPSCSAGSVVGPPRWLVSVILLLDLYEKAVLALNRRLPLVRGLGANRRKWKWFDERSGRWTAYTPANNQTIDEAYVSGLPTVRFSASRRKYSADFTSMIQVNEDSTHCRPMMLTWDKWEQPYVQVSSSETTSASEASNESNAPQQQNTTERTAVSITNQGRGGLSEFNLDLPNEPLEGLRSGHKEVLIRSCVQLLASPVDADTLHALLRLTLRLTRSYTEATLFAEAGGIRALLALDVTACQPFSGFTSLVTLIVRHVMEDPRTLQAEMERVVQGSVSQHVPPLALSGHPGVGNHGALSEMHYTLRVLGPATCRDPVLFTEVAKNQLRISLIPSGASATSGQNSGTSKRAGSGGSSGVGGSTNSGGGINQQESLADDDADARLASPSAVQRLRVATSSSLAQSSGMNSSNYSTKSTPQSNGSFTSVPPLSPVASQVVAELLETLVIGQETNNIDSAHDGVAGGAVPLLPRSAICRLLAELVASYPAVARLLVEHRYVGPPEPCSALSFIIDHLLPAQQLPSTTVSSQQGAQQSGENGPSSGTPGGSSSPAPGDKDAAALSRVLITTLAGCSQPPEVQQCLLHELRSGIQRALALPESPEKHARIQALTGLIGCVARAASQQPAPGRNSSAGGVPGNTCSAPSRLVALLIKRGLLSDLARVAHSLDLSSPHLAATVNSALRPLEMLTSSSHLAGTGPFRKGKSQGSQQHHGRSFADVVAGRSRGDLGVDEADEVAAGDDDDAEMDDNVMHRSAQEEGVGSGSVGGGVAIPTLDNIMEMILENDINGTLDAVVNRTIGLDHHRAPLEHHVRLEMELDRPEARGGLIELRQHQSSNRTLPEDEEMDDMELEEEDDDNVTVDGVDTGEHRDRERRHRRPHHSAVAGEDEAVDDVEPDEEDSHMMADDSTDRGANHPTGGGMSARFSRLEDEDDVVVPVEEADDDDDDDDDSDSETNDGPDGPPLSERVAITQVVPSSQQQENMSGTSVQVIGPAVSDVQGAQNGTGSGQENRSSATVGQAAEQDEDDEEDDDFDEEEDEDDEDEDELDGENPLFGPAEAGLGSTLLRMEQRAHAHTSHMGTSGQQRGSSNSANPFTESLFLQVDLEDMFPSHIFTGEGSNDSGVGRYLPSILDCDPADGLAPAVPPAPGAVAASHPLLSRTAGRGGSNVGSSSQGGSGTDRGGGSRSSRGRTLAVQSSNRLVGGTGNGSGRATTVGAAWHFLSGRANPPAILQRIFGNPSSGHDHTHLPVHISGGGGHFGGSGGHGEGNPVAATGRVLFANPILEAPDDWFVDMYDDPGLGLSLNGLGGGVGGSRGATHTNGVPSAHARWIEESRVLDGDSLHDAVALVKPEIVPHLEKLRDQELAQRKEKRARARAAQEKNKQVEQQQNTSGKFKSTTVDDQTSNEIDSVSGQRHESASGFSNNPSETMDMTVVIEPTTSCVHEDFAQSIVEGLLRPSLTGQGSSPNATGEPLVTTQQNDQGTRHAALTSRSGTTERLSTVSPVTMSGAFEQATTNTHASASGATSASTGAQADEEHWLADEQTSQSGASLGEGPDGPDPEVATDDSAPTEDQHTSERNDERGNEAGANDHDGDVQPMDTTTGSSPQRINQVSSDNRIETTEDNHENLMNQPTVLAPDESHHQIQANNLLSCDESGGNLMDTGTPSGTAPVISHDVHMISPEGSHLDTSAYSSVQNASNNCISEGGGADLTDQMQVHLQAETSSPQGEQNRGENVRDDVATGVGASCSLEDASQSSGAATLSGTGNEYSAILGDMEVPEGVDPSFLAALPEHMRQEVIQDHLRMQRLSQQQSQQSQPPGSSQNVAGNTEASTGIGASGSSGLFSEVNPEFLAALPPSIQEEVLAQQRAEQQRLAAASSAPDAPADPTAFFLTLPAGLRQTVLQDLDDSLLPVLPPDLAQEARTLRAQALQQRELLQDRFFSHTSGGTSTTLSRILRTAVNRIGGSGAGARYTIHTLPSRATGGRGGQSSWGWQSSLGGSLGSSSLMGRQRNLARQLVDWEALACLLVLLFVDEPRLHTARLHKVLRNLAAHEPTRRWLVQALLSMLDRAGANISTSGSATPFSFEQHNKSGTAPCRWLSVSLDAALGCRTAVFHLADGQVLIHPQAAHLVCRHALDALISLGKSFPQHFMPHSSHQTACQGIDSSVTSSGQPEDFWTLIVRLEQQSQQSQLANSKGKGKSVLTSAIKNQGGCSSKESVINIGTGKKNDQPSGSANGLLNDSSELGDSTELADGTNITSRDNLSATANSTHLHSAATTAGTSGKVVIEQMSGAHLAACPLFQLTLHLGHPVVRHSQLLTDRLLRLLALVVVAIEDRPTHIFSSATAEAATASTTSVPALAAEETTASQPSRSSDSLVVGVATEPASAENTATVETGEGSSPDNAEAAIVSGTNEISETTGSTGEVPSLMSRKEGFGDSKNSRNRSEEKDQSKIPCDYAGRDECTSDAANRKNDDEEVERLNKERQEREAETERVLCNHLRLAVDALTSKSCSEAGLEDATTLLLRLSKGSSSARKVVLRLLLEGARQLGHTLCEHIRRLEDELKTMRGATNPADVPADQRPGPNGSRGMIQDRFTSSAVVITAGGQGRVSGQSGTRSLQTGAASRELQLASMATLTAKTSSQAFLLRVLKVIIQLRNCAQNVHNAQQVQRQNNGGAGTSAAGSEPVRAVEPLPALSAELALDALWAKLSDCLSELADAPDQHAVLVLQPAVEAFFLVHAASFRDVGQVGNSGLQDRSVEGEGAPHRSVSGSLGTNSSSEPMATEAAEHLLQDMAPVSPAPQAESECGFEVGGTGSADEDGSSDMRKFLAFAETHRMVLNQILRQSTVHLPDGPFAVLVDHTRILDFDVKRKYFRSELDKADNAGGSGRREDVAIHVKREHVFEDSYRELHRRPPDDWRNRLYIVFEGEEGQDAGGLLREWYTIVSREIFNPMYALFTTSPGDRVTYMINPSSHCNSNHLSYFKFVGRVIAKAIYDNKLLECYFTRSFYKHILGKPVKYTDMESEDYEFYKGLVYLLEHNVEELGTELTFSLEVQEFGANSIKDLKPNGRHILVTEDTKQEYVRLVCQEKMTGAIRPQLQAFLEGFYEIIPKSLISIFNEQELELLISGLPSIDIDDLRLNTEYHKYQPGSLQIQWFWRALRSFEQADRAKFLQFVTGTSKVPLQGFASLEGMNGVQKFQIHRDDRSTSRLPSAHTCFNQLDLPAYETYDKLKAMLLKAIRECSEGFGFA